MTFLLSMPFNLIAFNVIWPAIVIGRDTLIWLLAPTVLLYAALLIARGRVKTSQIVLPAAAGILVDTCLSLSGVYQFENTSSLLPVWMIVLWFAFATTLSQSLAILGRNKLIASMVGALAVPLNYIVGERLGAMSFGYDMFLTVVVMSVVWAVLLPLLFYLAQSTPFAKHGSNRQIENSHGI